MALSDPADPVHKFGPNTYLKLKSRIIMKELIFIKALL